MAHCREKPSFRDRASLPRDTYLEGYSIKYPYVTKEKFSGSVNWVVSSENIFLTFMAELGFPFLLLYTFSLGYLLFRLIGKAEART